MLLKVYNKYNELIFIEETPRIYFNLLSLRNVKNIKIEIKNGQYKVKINSRMLNSIILTNKLVSDYKYDKLIQSEDFWGENYTIYLTNKELWHILKPYKEKRTND